MFEELSPIFRLTAAKAASGELPENEPLETKKCKKCLRRVELDWVKCPYCKSGDFQYNDS
jgi:Zn finger protein HypA/HybF involved in hydrogenase expression